jgi:uncharacterized protein YueI
MYPSDGLQNKKDPKDPNVFLGDFAEGIIEDIQRARRRTPGDYAFKGIPGGMEIKDEERRPYYT